jgi:hypothetical protein
MVMPATSRCLIDGVAREQQDELPHQRHADVGRAAAAAGLAGLARPSTSCGRPRCRGGRTPRATPGRRRGARRASRAPPALHQVPLAVLELVEHVARVVDGLCPGSARRSRSCRLTRGAEVHRLAAEAHDEGEVELLVLFPRGLVDRDDDGLAVLLGEVGQEVDERHRVVGGEARGGLVEEHQRGVGHQLQRDVDALALAAREHLLLGLADLEILLGVEGEVFDGLLDALLDLLVGVVGGRRKRALYVIASFTVSSGCRMSSWGTYPMLPRRAS